MVNRENRFAVRLVLPIVAAALLIGSILFWLDHRNHFPAVAPGLYAGMVEGVFSDDQDQSAPLLISSLDTADELLLALAGREPSATTVFGHKQQATTDRREPISFESPFGTLRFTGAQSGEKQYAGTVRNLDSGKSGRWQVEAVESGDVSIAARGQTQIKLWLKLKEELGRTEVQASELRSKIEADRAEIDKLAEAIAEGSRLKSSAEEKFVVVSRELQKAQDDLRQKQDQAKKLDEKLKVAQQVTAAGRLVALVHQTAEREARWAESMLRFGGDGSSPEIESALSRGAAVLDLQAQIEREKARINQLSAGAGVP
ncbi:MAG: hypothetical protein EBZ48_08770 [Proteobacteria bacterium]|nr:hypothetical protein [Pseudomonadota bacterium]